MSEGQPAYYHIHIEIVTVVDLFLINKLREGMSPITKAMKDDGSAWKISPFMLY